MRRAGQQTGPSPCVGSFPPHPLPCLSHTRCSSLFLCVCVCERERESTRTAVRKRLMRAATMGRLEGHASTATEKGRSPAPSVPQVGAHPFLHLLLVPAMLPALFLAHRDHLRVRGSAGRCFSIGCECHLRACALASVLLGVRAHTHTHARNAQGATKKRHTKGRTSRSFLVRSCMEGCVDESTASAPSGSASCASIMKTWGA